MREQTAGDLIHLESRLLTELKDVKQLLQANAKQVFSIKDLCERYDCGEKAVRQMLRKFRMMPPTTRGRPLQVNLEDVLQLDRELRMARA